MTNHFESPFKGEFLANQVTNPNIRVGRYSYYSGYYHGHSFGDCARYLMPDRDDVDRLVIGSFCSIGSGPSFISADNQGHRHDWVSAFLFFYMAGVRPFMNPLLALLFLLWSGFALADPASLPDELADEASMLGSILSDGRAVFYSESASYLSLSSLNGPGYSNGVAVLMTLGGWGGGATNNQYLALYAINDSIAGMSPLKTYRLLSVRHVGGKGDRLFTGVRETGTGLVLSGFGYAAEDPLCCPAKPLEVTFTFGARGELVSAASPTLGKESAR